MSKLKKLLEGVNVEWLALSDITSFTNGKGHEKVISDNGKFIVVNSKFVSTEGKIAKYSNEQICPLYLDDILIVMSDLPNGRALAKTYLVEADNKYTLNQRIGRITIKNTNQIVPRYLNYLLNRTPQLLMYNNGIDQTNLKKAEIQGILIPIPCPDNPEKSLKIQEEIVRFLDSLSEETNQLTAALQKELQLHQKRYDFYREELFKFEGKEVEWKSLEEVFDLKNGYTPSKQKKEYWTDGTVPWFRMEDIRRNGRVLSNSIQYVSESAVKGGKLFPANSIIIATSATIGEYALITVPYLSNQRFTNLSLKNSFTDIFIMKFMVHYSHLLGEWCKKNVTIGNFAGVDMGGFKKFPIAIPSLEEQERIVKILDDLDAKTLAITTAIKKEVALRNKQYEFYRDRLLSFSK